MTDTFTGPYYRIIPMHFTIMFGTMVTLVLGFAGITSTLPVLVIFLLLKTSGRSGYAPAQAHRMAWNRGMVTSFAFNRISGTVPGSACGSTSAGYLQ